MEKRHIPTILKQGRLAPWLYLAPALVIIGLFILYPAVNTLILSFGNRDGSASAASTCVAGSPCWGIFENYRYALTAEFDTSSLSNFLSSAWQSSYGNTLKWILLMVGGTVSLGLLFAVLVDRLRYKVAAKAVIFMPMAVSFVGAGVIWKFVYAYNTGRIQIGLLNTILTALGGKPVSFLTTPGINTIALIAVGIWMWTGFCMTVLSAAIKNIPEEITEAARTDGAGGWTIFWLITVPLIQPTLLVVMTTMVITVLKLFDIIYVMTGGNFGTNVIAYRFYTEMYTNFNAGRGSAIAIILILLITPFIYFNVRRFLEQEEELQ
jgi:alpha-glucoside transport system permease protein